MYYNVRATWDNNLDASQNAAFVVTHDDGPTTVFKNQHDGGDGWQDLGQFHLTAGQVYTVTLDAAQSTNGPRVFADAVRWETPGINATLLAATFVAGGNCCNRPWADVDADHDVDMTDFATFQACLTTDSNEILPECGCMDADGNGSIDSTDLAYFLACGLGPAIEFVHNSSSPYWPNWPVGCPNQPTE